MSDKPSIATSILHNALENPATEVALKNPATEVARDIRSFGRRRGRPLRPRQSKHVEKLLPKLTLNLEQPAPEPLEQIFSPSTTATWLEIGFGGGEHMIWQAQHNTETNADIGIIGCEPFLDGVAKVLDAVDTGRVSRLRLYTDDARDVLRWLPEASLARVFILFPDPWPKKRHRKRRLISPAFLDQVARVMRPGAELRLGTDIADYATEMLLAATQSADFVWNANGPQDWRERPSDWPQTRYEQKAIREGRSSYYFRFTKVVP